MQRGPKVEKEAIATLKDAGQGAPEIEGTPSGVEGLDELFFVAKPTEKGPRRQSLGGVPRGCVFNITGISDTGKSLMAEQFALRQAAEGYGVLFVTVETPAAFLASGLKLRAEAMGVPYDEVEGRLVIVDAASFSTLREELPSLLDTMAYAMRAYRVQATVVDSVTGLFEAREMMARQVVRALFNFLKKWHQTTLLVSQKRSGHEELSAEAAGGYAVSHIVDGTLVLSKRLISSTYDERLYGLPIGEVVRLFRIDGCRMCGHDTSTHLFEITAEGLVRIGPALHELKAKGRR